MSDKTDSFAKGHGLGNDYIVLDPEQLSFRLTNAAVGLICDRHFGIGSDGILTIEPSSDCDIGMGVINPDGSRAEMCGNGMRIFARYLYEAGIIDKTSFTVETMAGVIKPEIIIRDGAIAGVTVDMGKARTDAAEIPLADAATDTASFDLEAGGRSWDASAVSMGNPHCVLFVDEVNEADVRHYGPIIENLQLFPNRTNVQFVKPLSRDRVRAMIWERGAGFTLASGTSASAVAVAAYRRGLVDGEVAVEVPGGVLNIEVTPELKVRMTGPSVIAYHGRFDANFVEMMNNA